MHAQEHRAGAVWAGDIADTIRSYNVRVWILVGTAGHRCRLGIMQTAGAANPAGKPALWTCKPSGLTARTSDAFSRWASLHSAQTTDLGEQCQFVGSELGRALDGPRSEVQKGLRIKYLAEQAKPGVKTPYRN
jgi:hypothetical protein